MKRFMIAVAVGVIALRAISADAGVSVQIGQPGFYGRIDVGGFPAPQVIYPQPVRIQPVPVGIVQQPIYLHVPPGHAKHWNKHCGQYNACGQPVYFVQDAWYRQEYVPRYREIHYGGHGGHGKHKGHDDDD
jgi:hypothetical protein